MNPCPVQMGGGGFLFPSTESVPSCPWPLPPLGSPFPEVGEGLPRRAFASVDPLKGGHPRGLVGYIQGSSLWEPLLDDSLPTHPAHPLCCLLQLPRGDVRGRSERLWCEYSPPRAPPPFRSCSGPKRVPLNVSSPWTGSEEGPWRHFALRAGSLRCFSLHLQDSQHLLRAEPDQVKGLA